MRGEWHGRFPRTSQEVIDRMVELHEAGDTTREIAAKVGKSRGHVSQCLRRAGVPKRPSHKRHLLSPQARDFAFSKSPWSNG